jgi:hypothetical protein
MEDKAMKILLVSPATGPWKGIGVDAIQISILTPLPGTPLHTKLKDRIFDRNWEHYDYRHVVFTPKSMSPGDLKAGPDWVISRFYSPFRIAKRLLRSVFMPGGLRNIAYPVVVNLAYFGRLVAFGIRGYDPMERAAATEKELVPHASAEAA